MCSLMPCGSCEKALVSVPFVGPLIDRKVVQETFLLEHPRMCQPIHTIVGFLHLLAYP